VRLSTPTSRRGMTLIEVMVSVAILASMGALIYSGLVLTIRAQREAEMAQERYHAARISLSRMKRELSMAFISLHQAPDQRTKTLFEGGDDQVVFNTQSHEPWQRDAHESDQLEVEYRLDTVDGERVLIRRVKYYIDDRPERGGREEIMVRGVKDLELDYYNTRREDWQNDWSVRVENAMEMRTQLKVLQAARDQVEDIRNSEETGTAGVVEAAVADRTLDSLEDETVGEMFLPDRVRIHLELEDENDRIYEFETQAAIRVIEPLWY